MADNSCGTKIEVNIFVAGRNPLLLLHNTVMFKVTHVKEKVIGRVTDLYYQHAHTSA